MTRLVGIEPAPAGIIAHSEEEIRMIVAHAEETGNPKSRILSHTLLVPISPLLVVFAFIVAVKVLEVL